MRKRQDVSFVWSPGLTLLFWYTFYTRMGFEFDPAKSAANRAKHGIDFVEAQRLWDDPHFIEQPARSLTEARLKIVGRINNKTWAAFITYRHENIRLISVRRARPQEILRYAEGRVADADR